MPVRRIIAKTGPEDAQSRWIARIATRSCHFSLGEFLRLFSARFPRHVAQQPDRQFESTSVRHQVTDFRCISGSDREVIRNCPQCPRVASGVNCAAKERRRGESRSGEFRGIFSGARWRSPDSVRDHQRPFARKLSARSVDTRVHRLVGINVVFGSLYAIFAIPASV